ncbi:signal recognition particle-docking protein FtsY [Candidatus Phytoplasma tritici]|uniref:signal recognition particle-docking protein FtsY n=1 Tax=Candidatus Phytoplasma tritici TaxID=321961 RepID=UPI0004082736|nr:signal recognition particle-docking protein FtsY [Candidatus Phytoplasma tritici]
MFKWLKSKFFKSKNDDKYQLGLKKTKASFLDFQTLLKQSNNIEQSLLQALESLLIQADFGTKTILFLMQSIKDEINQFQIKNPQKLPSVVVSKMFDLYQNMKNMKDTLESSQEQEQEKQKIKQNQSPNSTNPKDTFTSQNNFPQMYLFTGVNGVGKTTTIGKMAEALKQEGKKVLLIAADTFRAGAVAQLQIWAKRVGVEVFCKPLPTHPASVIFEGIEFAKSQNYDIILCDTAGRLQNKTNLMQELAKINRVICKHLPASNLQTFLVLDATTGQNALNQVDLFNQATPLSGAILTKLDGTSKGGIIFAIKYLYNLPTKYIGVGEKAQDLITFDVKNYLFNLFEGFFTSEDIL